MCVSLWVWWEVVAVHHQVHDYACCHLHADCLESGISSGPLRSTMSMGTFTFTFLEPQRDLYNLSVISGLRIGPELITASALDGFGCPPRR